VASKEIGAKQLAMYADNPVRYCNLRGQLEGPSVSQMQRNDEDLVIRPDRLLSLLSVLLILGLGMAGLGANEFFQLVPMLVLNLSPLEAILLLIAGAAMSVASVAGLIKRWKLRRPHEICERFELDPAQNRIVTAAIMGNRGRIFSANGLSAVPHAVFMRRGTKRSYHVALLLSRPYAGKVHDSDLFRLTLHMGIVKRQLGIRMVTGSIRYAGKLVKIAYSDSLYNSLKSMAPEYREAVKRWWPENRLSLRQRQRVAAGAAMRSHTVDWPDEYSV